MLTDNQIAGLRAHVRTVADAGTALEVCFNLNAADLKTDPSTLDVIDQEIADVESRVGELKTLLAGLRKSGAAGFTDREKFRAILTASEIKLTGNFKTAPTG